MAASSCPVPRGSHRVYNFANADFTMPEEAGQGFIEISRPTFSASVVWHVGPMLNANVDPPQELLATSRAAQYPEGWAICLMLDNASPRKRHVSSISQIPPLLTRGGYEPSAPPIRNQQKVRRLQIVTIDEEATPHAEKPAELPKKMTRGVEVVFVG